MKQGYIAVALICAASGVLTACGGHKENNNVNEPRSVEVASVATDSVTLHKTYPGYLTAGTTANVVAQVNGRILKKCYVPGSFVKKGTVLFRIDPGVYADDAASAKASLESAISQRDYAKSNYEAIKRAFDVEAVSRMRLLTAESSLEQAEAQVRQAEASLRTANTNLGHCTVTAPISGYVSDATLDEGNYVAGEGSPITLATVYDNSEMTASFEIEDAQYEMMLGQQGGMGSHLLRHIPLCFQGKLSRDYFADLVYQAPAVDRNTGTILLKGKIDNIDNELKEGMYVTVDLPYGTEPEAMLVLDASIGTDQLGKYVYLVNDSNRVVYTPIKVGEIYRDSLRIVESGLKPGDRYVTKALLTVRNGETVKPEPTR